MDKFIVMNSNGEFGIEVVRNGFGGNGSTNLRWTLKINEATLFTPLSFRNVNDRDVIAKLPAEETRIVRLLGRD